MNFVYTGFMSPCTAIAPSKLLMFSLTHNNRMCCRYHIQESAIDYLHRFGDDTFRSGDVHPGDNAPAIIAGEANPVVAHLKWGLSSRCKSLIINARSETLWEKPMFRESIAKRRCVLPADCFYEWDRQKTKNTFYPSAGGVLFLAGIYSQTGNFVVITTQADSVMQPVHDRMPICLQENQIQGWLFDECGARSVLAGNEGVPLQREKLVEQLFLWE